MKWYWSLCSLFCFIGMVIETLILEHGTQPILYVASLYFLGKAFSVRYTMLDLNKIIKENVERRRGIKEWDDADVNSDCDCQISGGNCYILQHSAPEACDTIDALVARVRELEDKK